jgi:hypothetical protein
MSPKSRGRKKKTDTRRSRPRREGLASPASQPLSAQGSRVDGWQAPAPNSPWPDLRQAFAAGVPAVHALAERFRPLLASDDLLAVEETTAELIAQTAHANSSGLDLDLAMGVVALAARHPEPQVAAMACALDAFMPGMATRMALGDLTRCGVPMPGWRDRLGGVLPGPAWRFLDRYGEQRAVLATFCYGETPHSFLAMTNPWPATHVLTARVLRSAGDELRRLTAQNIEQRGGGPVVQEPMTPQELRGNLQAAVYRVPGDLTLESQIALEILRQRLNTLPPPARTPNHPRTAETGPQPPEQPDDAARARANRDAAVAAFLSTTSPEAEVDHAVLRFWAQVMAGATAVCQAAPTHVSPAWLDYLLEQYTPQTIELSAAQRAGLRPAVTAWARWATGQRRLPAEALDTVTARIIELDESFDSAYTDPTTIALRCYLRDVVATTVDGDDLRRTFLLRTTAVPMPRDRQHEYQHLLASEPDQREQLLAGVLTSWDLPEDSEPQWSNALHRVSAQLWNGEPSELTTAIADYLLSVGSDQFLLADLAELAVEHAADEQAFLDAAIQRVTVGEEDLDHEWPDDPDDD